MIRRQRRVLIEAEHSLREARVNERSAETVSCESESEEDIPADDANDAANETVNKAAPAKSVFCKPPSLSKQGHALDGMVSRAVQRAVEDEVKVARRAEASVALRHKLFLFCQPKRKSQEPLQRASSKSLFEPLHEKN